MGLFELLFQITIIEGSQGRNWSTDHGNGPYWLTHWLHRSWVYVLARLAFFRSLGSPA